MSSKIEVEKSSAAFTSKSLMYSVPETFCQERLFCSSHKQFEISLKCNNLDISFLCHELHALMGVQGQKNRVNNEACMLVSVSLWMICWSCSDGGNRISIL